MQAQIKTSSMLILVLSLLSLTLAIPQGTPPPSVASPIDIRFPNYIIPVYSAQPNFSNGTQFSGHISWTSITNEIATEIVFDNVPVSNGASYCKFNFALSPTGPFSIAGQLPWSFSIYWIIGGFVGLGDSWNNRPGIGGKIADVTISAAGDLAVTVSDHAVPCEVKTQILLRAGKPFDISWFGEFFYLCSLFYVAVSSSLDLLANALLLHRVGFTAARYCARDVELTVGNDVPVD
jgi:hypothetical protein